MGEHALDHVGVVVDAELVGHREQQGVRGGDRLVLGELGDQLVRLARVRPAEPGAAAVQEADLVGAAALLPEQLPVQIVDDREDAAADRDARLTVMPGGLPRVPEPLDLLGLELMEGHAGVLGEQCRAHQVEPLLGRPLGGRAGACAPPDPVPQAGRVRLDPQQARRVREHRARVGPGETLAAEHLEEHAGVLAGHVGVALAFGRGVSEVAETVDHLLRRAAADTQLQPATGDQVGGTGVLGHVERVLVAHVDHGGAQLDPAGPRRGRGQQRERRGELLGEVVHAVVSAVGTRLLRGHREFDRLQQGVRPRAHQRVPGRRPVPEGQEPNLLHIGANSTASGGIPMGTCPTRST